MQGSKITKTVEFARGQEQLFDRWLTSKNVNDDFNQLRQLVLVEQFKSCVHADIKTHLDERDVNSLGDAATISDDYALTHKLSSGSSSGGPNRYNQGSKGYANRSNQNKSAQEGAKEGKSQSSSSGQGNKPSSNSKPKSGDGYKPLKCNYCKENGHTYSTCWKLMGKQLAQKQATTPTMCAVPTMPQVASPVISQEIKPNQVESEKVREDFEPFVIEGEISLDNEEDSLKSIKIVRDTCCGQSMILEGSLPFSDATATGEHVLVEGIGMNIIKVPLHKMNLKSGLVSGPVVIGVRPKLPIKGVSMLLGNDLAGEKVLPEPIVSNKPCTEVVSDEEKDIFPACAVTRAMSKKASQESSEDKPTESVSKSQKSNELVYDLEDTFLTQLNDEVENTSQSENSNDSLHDPLSHDKLILEQENEPELREISKRALNSQEAEQNPVCFYKQNGVLMRKWRPPDAPADEEWKVVHQIVVPKVYHSHVISIAHDSAMAGHLGVRKTHDKILRHFWWPTLRKDVSEYCKSCHTCQVVGKPNQKIPPAPLKPIPAFEEPFSRVMIDCVGPLPKTRSGNQYMLTIMCASTRFPEAIPLRNIKAATIVKALTKFFTFVGLPKSIQSDQGSNFTSNLFQQVMYELGIEQYTSSAYHPESQGALERFHQTLKNMIRTYCLEFEKDWDEGVHLLLFAARESVQETLGFSPFELVFGHTVRGPLKLLKEKWLSDSSEISLLDYVSKFKYRLNRATDIAKENLKQGQAKMKQWYDQKTRSRVFKPGDKVLVLFPIPGNPLQARYFGPYEVESKVGEVDYVVKTPGRRKSRQLCHINMLKEYFERSIIVKVTAAVQSLFVLL